VDHEKQDSYDEDEEEDIQFDADNDPQTSQRFMDKIKKNKKIRKSTTIRAMRQVVM